VNRPQLDGYETTTSRQFENMKSALRMARSLLLGLLGVAVVLASAMAAMLYLAIDSTPRVAGAASLTPAHIERAKRLLDRNDPRTLRPGVLRTIVVSEEDLDLAVNYLANRFAKGSSKIELSDGKAHAQASVLLPPFPFVPAGRYLNIDAALGETAVLPQFDHLKIGQLRIPAFIANRILRASIARLQRSASYGAATDTIKHVSSRNGLLNVVYEWNEAVPDQLASVLVPVEDQLRMQAYQARLAELTAPGGQPALRPTRLRPHPPYSLSLSSLVQALFQLAGQRGGDAAAEHRAAIIVMAFYVNGKGLGAIIPAARQWPVPALLGVTLAGRDDFSQHFTISAALAATAGSPLSDAVGLYKEVDDSRGGSGFSFSDIAADRAGTRFGELTTGSDAGIRKIQRLLVAGMRDADLLPAVKDLPEFMQEAEFKRRYGGIGKPAYTQVMKDIEQRISALPLYQR
jgi:hypothetical protein